MSSNKASKEKLPMYRLKKASKEKPKNARERLLKELTLKERDEKKNAHDKLVSLMLQINGLLRKEKKNLTSIQRNFKGEDPRSIFYYKMLRRIGLPEIHARFAPWFLKFHKIKLSRWSSILFARLEQAFFAIPENLPTLEKNMKGHQEHYNLLMKCDDTSGKKLIPRQKNQLILRRAYRESTFNVSESKMRRRQQMQENPLLLTPLDRIDSAEFDRIPLVSKVHAPPGLAPQVEGQVESHGKHLYFTYSGRWKDGEMHGPMGVYTYADGGKYTGAWKDSKPCGSGVLSYPNGTKYTGAFKNGKFHGYGVMEMDKGFKYEGQWQNGIRHGKGKLTFLSSGCCYEGEFFQNMRNGQGTENNSIGYSYQGNWRQNRIYGRGVIIFPNGRTVTKEDWPPCMLGEAVRIARKEVEGVREQEERMYRSLLRVRDDLRALDLQYAWWEAEDARKEREEEEHMQRLKQARKDKREAQTAAKMAFLEKAQYDAEDASESGSEGENKTKSKKKNDDDDSSQSEDDNESDDGESSKEDSITY